MEGTKAEVDQHLWYDASNRYQFFLPGVDSSETIIGKCRENTTTLGVLFPYKLIRTGESVGVKEPGFVVEERERNNSIEEYEYCTFGKNVDD